MQPDSSTEQQKAKRPPLRYETVDAPDHPLAKVGGYVYRHEAVLYARIGPGPHPCHWCGRLVDWKQKVRRKMVGVLCTDHLNGIETDNRSSNLVASCFRCNISRAHPQNFGPSEDWVRRGSQRLRYHIRTCAGCGQDFKCANFVKTSKDHVGRFCSLECYRKSIMIPDGEPYIVRKDGFRQRAVELNCPECGTPFLYPKAHINRKGLKFCGKACSAGYYAKLRPRDHYVKMRSAARNKK